MGRPEPQTRHMTFDAKQQKKIQLHSIKLDSGTNYIIFTKLVLHKALLLQDF